MIHVMARIVARPEAADALKKVLLALVDPSRNEPGCISYSLFQRSDAPHEFQTVEQWRSQADADAHMRTKHVQEVVAAAVPLLGQPPLIQAFVLLT